MHILFLKLRHDFLSISSLGISLVITKTQRCHVLRLVCNYYAHMGNITVLRAAVKNYRFLILKFFFFQIFFSLN